MKYILTTLALAASLSAAAQQSTSMTVGYCSDESTDAIGLTEKGLNVAAVKFDSDFLAQYAGNQVKAITLQLGASFGSAGSVFVSDELTAPVPDSFDAEWPIPDFDFVPCYKWIDVPIDQPFVISPDHPFYVGIRILPYTQAPYYGTYQFAIDENPTGAAHCYLYDEAKGKWKPVTDYSFEGCKWPNLLIKLRLEGDALPMNDVSVGDLQSMDYLRTTDSGSCAFTVTNVAANDVTDYEAELLLDGAVSQTRHVTLATPLATREQTTCTFDGVAFAAEGTHTVGVRVSAVNGVADTHSENNMAEREVSVIDRYYDHHVLVEAFTTMSCANCPIAHEKEEEAFRDNTEVVRVDHHSGFGTDVLTNRVDSDFLWFFNNGGSTYAPGIMFNRVMVDDFFDPQRSIGEEHSPIFGPGEAENMRFIYNHLAALPAYVDVNIDADYDASTRQLNVTVSGEAIALLQGGNPTINLWLTESGLSAANDKRLGQMTGSGKLDMTFVHNNVIRKTLTGSWGHPITLGLAPYSQYFSTNLDADWVAENMEIVAFIANYDSQHPDKCMVHNVAALPISRLIGDDADGVVALSGPKTAAPTYDLAGRKVTTKAHGITINAGRKVVR